MKPAYRKLISEDFTSITADRPVDFTLIDELSDLRAALSKGVTTAVIIQELITYVTDGSIQTYQVSENNGYSTKQYDFRTVLPANYGLGIVIASSDVNSIIALEDYFSAKYRETRTLLLPIAENSDNIPVEIGLETSEPIRREQMKSGNTNVNISCLPIFCKNTPVFVENFHPAQVAFDDSIQQEIIQQVSAVYDYAKGLSASGDTEKSKELITTGKQRLISSQFIPEKLSTQWYIKAVQKVLDERKCTVAEAIKQIQDNFEKYEQERMKEVKHERAEERHRQYKEEKRKEEAEKKARMFSKHGDEVINRFTDAVVADFKSRIKTGYDISFYGGSSYMTYCEAVDKQTLKLPVVLIRAMSSFTFNCDYYLLRDTEGQTKTYHHDINALPIAYGVTASVISDNSAQMEEIVSLIQAAYSGLVELWVPNQAIPGTECLVKLQLSSTVEAKKGSLTVGNTKYPRSILTFNQYYNVYFPKDYGKEAIEDNPRLQYRLLQEAEYMLLCHSKMRSHAIPQINSDYKSLLSQKSSLLGFLKSQEFKQLKSCYDRRMPIDQNLFNRCFADTVKFYPSLYDKFMQGWGYEQIKAEVEALSEQYKSQWEKLCDLLSIPKTLSLFYTDGTVNGRDQKRLAGYMAFMAYTNKTVSEAIDAYYQKLQNEDKQEQERQRQLQEERAARAQWESEHPREESGGASLLGGLVGGVASHYGGKIKNTWDNAGKPDLFGTPQCPYGKPMPGRGIRSSATIHCDISCPLKYKCRGGH